MVNNRPGTLTLVGIGNVVEDLKPGSDSIYISITEYLVYKEGDLVAEESISYTTTDIDGNVTTVNKTKDDKIYATWIQTPNRILPPTVCKGETVQVYRIADTDKYYWSTIYNELELRKLEVAHWVFSNKRKIGNRKTGLTWIKQVYEFIVNTVDKYIRLRTDMSDGEMAAYNIELNTGEGIAFITDQKENSFTLYTPESVLHISIIEDIHTMSKNNYVTANETMSLLSKYAKRTGTLTIDDITKIYTLNAADLANIHSETINNTATKTFNVTTPVSNFKTKDFNVEAKNRAVIIANNIDEHSKKHNISATQYKVMSPKITLTNGRDDLVKLLSDLALAVITENKVLAGIVKTKVDAFL